MNDGMKVDVTMAMRILITGCLLIQVLNIVGAEEACGEWEYRSEFDNQCRKCHICREPIVQADIYRPCYEQHPQLWHQSAVWCTSGGIPSCPILEVPDGGQFICDNSHFLGSTCQLKCEDGYTLLQGVSEHIYCYDSGEWNRPPPTCVLPNAADTEQQLQDHRRVIFGLGISAAAIFVTCFGLVIAWLCHRYRSGVPRCPICGLSALCSHDKEQRSLVDIHDIENGNTARETSPFVAPETSEQLKISEDQILQGRDGLGKRCKLYESGQAAEESFCVDLKLSHPNVKCIDGKVNGEPESYGVEDVNPGGGYADVNPGGGYEDVDPGEGYDGAAEACASSRMKSFGSLSSVLIKSVENLLAVSQEHDDDHSPKWKQDPSHQNCLWHMGPGHVEFIDKTGGKITKGEHLVMEVKPKVNQVLHLVVWEHIASGRTYACERLDILSVDKTHEGWYQIMAYTNNTLFDRYQLKIRVVDEPQGVENPSYPTSFTGEGNESGNLPSEGYGSLPPDEESGHSRQQGSGIPKKTAGPQQYNIPPMNDLISRKENIVNGEETDRCSSIDDNTQQPGLSLASSRQSNLQNIAPDEFKKTITGANQCTTLSNEPESSTRAIVQIHKRPIDNVLQEIMGTVFPPHEESPATSPNVHVAVQERGGRLSQYGQTMALPSPKHPQILQFPYVVDTVQSPRQPVVAINSTRRRPGSSPGESDEHYYEDIGPVQCELLLEKLANDPDAMKFLAIVMETSHITDSIAHSLANMDGIQIQHTRLCSRGLESVTARVLHLACRWKPEITVGTLVELMAKAGHRHVLQVLCHYHRYCTYCSTIYKK